MANCWERAFPLAFHLCCFYFSAVLIVGPFSRLVFRAGCGIRLNWFLIITFLSTYNLITFCACKNHYKQGSHHVNEPGHEKMCLMLYANNKGADQPAHPRSLISAFVVRCLDNIISLDAIAEISRL